MISLSKPECTVFAQEILVSLSRLSLPLDIE